MTKQLMTLAGGKVVLVLEGGYILPALCDTAEMCLRALLHMEVSWTLLQVFFLISHSLLLKQNRQLICLLKIFICSFHL